MELFHELMNLAKKAAKDETTDIRELAERAVKPLSMKRLRQLAIVEVEGWIDHYRREIARKIEEQAQCRQRELDREDLAKRTAESQHLKAEFYASPVTNSNFLQMCDPLRPGNASERKWFKKQLGDRFDDWYVLADEYVKSTKPSDFEMFESDWYEYGVREYYASKQFDAMISMVRQVAKETRLQVTEELLSSVFALGDGRTVSWRTATIADHEQRITMLTKNAAGIVETAALHQAAIEMLKTAGVDRLGDIT